MKSNLISILICFLLVLVLSMIAHWLVGLAVVFIFMALRPPPTWTAFAIGFLAVFIAWAGTATFLSSANQHLLSNQVGELFGGISPAFLMILTGILGGIAGGLVASSAAVLFGRKEGKVGL